jgi:ubiquinone/menaquinone biosynthesis C-methylase UbiE
MESLIDNGDFGQTANTAPYLGRTKYTAAAAARYQHRPIRKDRAEQALVRRALVGIPAGIALDVPCGGGRMSRLLHSHGFQVTAGDLSPAMLSIARDRTAGLGIDVVRADVENLRFPDRGFDVSFCFRLFQHFPSAAVRRRAIHELCRVSRSHVMLSYFTPWCVTALKRWVETALLRKRRTKFHNSLREIRGYFADSGFEIVKDYAQKRGVHALHLAVFRRRTP